MIKNLTNVLIFKRGWVYCLHDAEHGFCRIGESITPCDRRAKGQVASYPFHLTFTSFPVENTNYAETYFHNHFDNRRHKADWFYIEPQEFVDLQPAYHAFYVEEYRKADIIRHWYESGDSRIKPRPEFV